MRQPAHLQHIDGQPLSCPCGLTQWQVEEERETRGSSIIPRVEKLPLFAKVLHPRESGMHQRGALHAVHAVHARQLLPQLLPRVRRPARLPVAPGGRIPHMRLDVECMKPRPWKTWSCMRGPSSSLLPYDRLFAPSHSAALPPLCRTFSTRLPPRLAGGARSIRNTKPTKLYSRHGTVRR
eukprot:366577-Chlamydomonas_euryale.AAC.5